MTDPSGPSDHEVVRAVLAGDREKFRLLVRRYEDILFRHAERMVGGHDEAADIVQKALVVGYKKLARCRDPERVGGWLFRIMSNQCKDYLKSRRRKDVSLEDVPSVASDHVSAGGEIDRMELRASLAQALARLNDEQREAFVMKHLEGSSYEEMSESLGVSVSALKMRVHRAREELQVYLKVYR